MACMALPASASLTVWLRLLSPPAPLTPQGFSDSWYDDYITQPTTVLATNPINGKQYKAIVMPKWVVCAIRRSHTD